MSWSYGQAVMAHEAAYAAAMREKQSRQDRRAKSTDPERRGSNLQVAVVMSRRPPPHTWT
jgi:hypothetical protein